LATWNSVLKSANLIPAADVGKSEYHLVAFERDEFFVERRRRWFDDQAGLWRGLGGRDGWRVVLQLLLFLFGQLYLAGAFGGGLFGLLVHAQREQNAADG
jgi:hypothetical protein